MDIILEPPSSEGNGRSINIDLTHRVKRRINNLYFVDSMNQQSLSYQSINSAYPAGRGTYISGYDSIHIVPIAGPDPDFIRVWDARFPSDDNIDNDQPDEKHVFIDVAPVVKNQN